MDAKQTTQQREAFCRYLQANGKRLSLERMVVFDIVAAMSGRFAISRVVEAAESSAIMVSRATVFSTMKLLLDAGVVRSYVGVKGKTYERVRASSSAPTINMVCSTCGKVHRRSAATLREWVARQPMRDFKPSARMELFVYGTCAQCRRAAAAKKVNTKN